jgi:hypothetical protein
MDNFETILPFIFPFYFVGLWCFVLRILSLTSGWTKLAKQFHSPNKFEGEYYRFQSARMGLVSFNNALGIGVNEQGLYLAPMIIFRLFHRPLLIPWHEIHVESFKRFFFKGYRLTFKSVPQVRLELYNRTIEKIIGFVKAKTNLVMKERDL